MGLAGSLHRVEDSLSRRVSHISLDKVFISAATRPT